MDISVIHRTTTVKDAPHKGVELMRVNKDGELSVQCFGSSMTTVYAADEWGGEVKVIQ